MQTLVATLCAAAALLTVIDAEAFVASSVGGHEGEIDMNATFIGEFGKVEPTERPTTWQKANIKILNFGAGYTIGKLGPLEDFYVRVEGAYYNAAAEVIDNPDDDLLKDGGAIGLTPGQPVEVYGADRGGYVTATIAANLVHETRFSFGLFLQGTVPIDVNFQKFSNVHLHYVGGGATIGVFITEPTKLVRLAYASRTFVGSGAYKDGYQHNASVAMTNLFVVEFARWALPWRMGVMAGPYFEGDLNEHVNRGYNDLYRKLDPDLVNGDRVRAMRFAIAVLPYFRITNNAALELGYVQKLFGYDPPATQFWTGGVRATF